MLNLPWHKSYLAPSRFCCVSLCHQWVEIIAERHLKIFWNHSPFATRKNNVFKLIARIPSVSVVPCNIQTQIWDNYVSFVYVLNVARSIIDLRLGRIYIYFSFHKQDHWIKKFYSNRLLVCQVDLKVISHSCATVNLRYF